MASRMPTTAIRRVFQSLRNRDALDRLARAPGPLGMRRIRNVAETAALAVAIAIFAKAAVMIAAPVPAPPTPQAELAGSPDAFLAAASGAGGHPFRGADDSPVASSAPLTESALNIVLYGTWRGSAGASAMISADGAPQRKVAAGEEIVVGVTLEEVQDEFVVISNNGAREAVAIVNRKVDVSAPAPDGEVVGDEAPPPSRAPLRDAALGGAALPLTVSAEGDALFDEQPADTIAAAAPHETD